MASINYLQYGLSPRLDSGLTSALRTSDDMPIVYVVKLVAKDGKVALTMLNAATDKNEIVISQNCYIHIVLQGGQLFFSNEYAAITTKEELSSYYGDLTYETESYDKTYGRYTAVKFAALVNSGGRAGTIHPFNINVDLLQEDEKGNQTWIGLSIDPDIINPPPIAD